MREWLGLATRARVGTMATMAMRAVVVRWWIVDRVVGWILLVRGARARGAGGARARAGKGRRARERG